VGHDKSSEIELPEVRLRVDGHAASAVLLLKDDGRSVVCAGCKAVVAFATNLSSKYRWNQETGLRNEKEPRRLVLITAT